MRVPFFGLDREFARYRTDFMRVIEEVLASGKVLQGDAIGRFEKHVAALTSRKFGVAVDSCTDALAFSLMANGIGPGDEIIITSFSFFASVSPILRVGATPVFVDIEPDYYMMDTTQLESALSDRTRGVIAVHLFGQPLPMNSVEQFCARHNLVLIEDAAQVLGARLNGRPCGNMGVCSCVSFDPTKVIGSFGSGGILLTDDEAIATTARMFRYHGRNPKTRLNEILGFNSQMATDKAAALDFKLDHMEIWQESRTRVARQYKEKLAGVSQVKLPGERPGATHVWHKFVIEAQHRDQLQEFLKNRGIETMVHYAGTLCSQPVVLNRGIPKPTVPIADSVTHKVLSLPVHAHLTEEEVDYVAESIRLFYHD